MNAPARISIRSADASCAPQLHALIAANREEGCLLPRALGEIAVPAKRFVVALKGRTIIWCSEPGIAPGHVVSAHQS